MRWIKANERLPSVGQRKAARYPDSCGDDAYNYAKMKVGGGYIAIGPDSKTLDDEYLSTFLHGWEWLDESVQAVPHTNVGDMKLDIKLFSLLSAERAEKGFRTYKNVPITYWTTALAGEVGELCNMIKKMERVSHGGIDGGSSYTAASLSKTDLAEEVGGIFIYLNILSGLLDINMEEAIIDTFNSKSEKYGFEQKYIVPAQITETPAPGEAHEQQIRIPLNHGATARVAPNPSPELVNALNTMVDLAMKMPPKEEATGEVPAIPADVVKLCETIAEEVCPNECYGNGPGGSGWQKSQARLEFIEGAKNGALAMWKYREALPAARGWKMKYETLLQDNEAATSKIHDGWNHIANELHSEIDRLKDQLIEVTNDRDVWKQWHDALKKKMDAALSSTSLEEWLTKNNPYTNHDLSSMWTEGATARAEADAASIAALTEQIGVVQGERDGLVDVIRQVREKDRHGFHWLPPVVRDLVIATLEKYPKQ